MQRGLFSWMLFYDGKGFKCEVPMRVVVWRGMTKKAHAVIGKGEA
jgi:hypothetical protein